jgi:hypothetical protein
MPRNSQGHPPHFDPIRSPEVRAAHNKPDPSNNDQIVPWESGGRRVDEVIAEVRSLITDDRIRDCFRVLAEARHATIWVRGAPANGQRFGYVEVPDHASRLASARIELAYRFGNPVSASEIRLLQAPADEQTRLSPEDQLRELRATGLDLEGIVRTWVEGLEKVSPSAKTSAESPENAENTPTAPLADAFLDI